LFARRRASLYGSWFCEDEGEDEEGDDEDNNQLSQKDPLRGDPKEQACRQNTKLEKYTVSTAVSTADQVGRSNTASLHRTMHGHDDGGSGDEAGDGDGNDTGRENQRTGNDPTLSQLNGAAGIADGGGDQYGNDKVDGRNVDNDGDDNDNESDDSFNDSADDMDDNGEAAAVAIARITAAEQEASKAEIEIEIQQEKHHRQFFNSNSHSDSSSIGDGHSRGCGASGANGSDDNVGEKTCSDTVTEAAFQSYAEGLITKEGGWRCTCMYGDATHTNTQRSELVLLFTRFILLLMLPLPFRTAFTSHSVLLVAFARTE
jgi:hypothetical protein